MTRTNESDCIKIRKYANSDFSHALIYQGDFSCLESHVGGVKSINIQRLVFKNEDDVIVLRHKEGLTHFDLVEIVNNAKQKVAISYASSRELYRSYVAKLDSAREENRQFCTRYVAQAYNETGHPIVENADYCSPKDIEDSESLNEVENIVRLASERELAIASEKNPITDIQEYTVYEFFEKIRKSTSTDIQSFEQLDSFLLENTKFDTQICEYLNESEYLKLAAIEKENNPTVYDFELFKKTVPKEGRYYNAILNINGEYQRIRDTKFAIDKYKQYYQQSNCQYFKMIHEHYEKLLGFCNQRLYVWESSINENEHFAYHFVK